MPVGESIVVALFIWAVVFVVLFVLYSIVMLLSKALAVKVGKRTADSDSEVLTSAAGDDSGEVVQVSSGELRLKNVDEKTAAMIMAIVSDESKIPLSELCFKSITLVE